MPLKPAKRKKKTSRPRGYSNSHLDNLWSEQVKKNGVCELCNFGVRDGGGKLTAHHFYGRRNRVMRWWVSNGVCLCENHHTRNRFSAHLNPAWFQQTMVSIRGQDWLDNLIDRASIVFHWQKHLEEIKLYLKGELNDYIH